MAGRRTRGPESTPASHGAPEPAPRRSGRPPKFTEPRRPITVTLPERTLEQLGAIDADRALAIVRATEAFVGAGRPVSHGVELVEVSPGRAMIFVGPSPSLRRIPWLQLAETAAGRNMLIIPSGTAVDSLEVELHDLLENEPTIAGDERSLLEELRRQLGSLRRSGRISKAEIIFFDIRKPDRARAGGAAPSRGALKSPR